MKHPQIRRFPYPYEAMLAISSDLDMTPDAHIYLEIARFLNTKDQTAIGRGIGLEVGNTIYFDMPPDQFSYWNTDDAGRGMIRSLIRSGHIDCFHSYGDLARSRIQAQQALEELDRHNCQIQCWIDHAAAPTNFGADIMRGVGDVPGDEAYHADLTYNHGVRFVWRGRVTSMIGQNCRPTLRSMLASDHLVPSLKTVAVESAKIGLGYAGNGKYAMHAKNDLFRPASLRDGRSVYEFMRCNPYWGGVSGGATADGIAEVLTSRFLERLVARRGVSILYTHLGKTHSREEIFSQPTVAAFQRLADVAHAGSILVTTTRRLLGYCLHSTLVGCEVQDGPSGETILLDTTRCKSSGVLPDLSGLTINVRRAETARLFIDGNEMPGLQRNPADNFGQQSVSLPWKPLEFPS